jgi:hypothetical protein
MKKMVNGKEMPRVGSNHKGMIEEREGERMEIKRGKGEWVLMEKY